MSGNEFAEKTLDQILAQGVEIEVETVESVENLPDRKLVRTLEGSSYESRTVILAPGVRHRMLGLPGEDELVGEGISFCAVCDGDFYPDQVISCDGLFVAIGLIPENEPFRNLAALNAYGYFDSDERCLTQTPGIFVAGDCRSKGVRQLSTAVADGATAACRYLNE